MPLDCDGFADELAAYLEGDASDAVRAAVESHTGDCAACRQLLNELTTIRHDAEMLPKLAPSRDLWEGIAERIDARVIPMESSARSAAPIRRLWARPAVAAAALVIATAGVTHMATRATMSNVASVPSAATSASSIAASGTAPVPVAKSDSVITPSVSEVAAAPSQSIASPATVRRGTGASAPSAVQRVTARASAPVAEVRLVSTAPVVRGTEPVYDREIIKLRQIVRSRRSQLDPKTIAVLEQSIAVIDSAIAQSRAALANDPASGFLATQLNHSLEKKVELLRTAALLPART